jgi:hypothetical protein
MSDNIKFRWEVEEGRTEHTTSIPRQEILEAGSIEEAEDLVRDIIEEDFNQRCFAVYSQQEVLRIVTEIRGGK